MKTGNITIKMDSAFDKCPECKSVAMLRRSHSRSAWEQILKRSKMGNIYRCRQCGWRGFKFGFSLRGLSFKTFFIYAALILATAVVVRFIITKFVIR
ncbi:MAG: hypothetical protein ABIG69_05990 [Bacteroidota bacterium]